MNIDQTFLLRNKKDALERELAVLMNRKISLQCADALCYQNGKMAIVDRDIEDKRQELKDHTQKMTEAGVTLS